MTARAVAGIAPVDNGHSMSGARPGQKALRWWAPSTLIQAPLT
jgi:hypothetical protein